MSTNWYARANAQVSHEIVERFTGRPIAHSAAHEAAHAVAVLALGVELAAVSIAAPRPVVRPAESFPLADYVLAVVAAAGLVADRWTTPERTALYLGPDTDEQHMVRSIVHSLHGGIGETQMVEGEPVLVYDGCDEAPDAEMILGAMFNAVGIVAWQVLRANRAPLDALTNALLREPSGTLTGVEARACARGLRTYTRDEARQMVETEALKLAWKAA